jgi:hypothetical protein
MHQVLTSTLNNTDAYSRILEHIDSIVVHDMGRLIIN